MSSVYVYRSRGRIVAAAATRKELVSTYHVSGAKPVKVKVQLKTRNSKPRSVWLSWCKNAPIKYDFPSEDHVNAFIKGIMEANDRTGLEFDLEQFDTIEEVRERFGDQAG